MIVTFAIGNSDDKLSQARWSQYVRDVQAVVGAAVVEGAQVHMSGYSNPEQPWQNAVWALDLGPNAAMLRGELRSELASLCGSYGQDSIAWWEAHETEFIPPASADS